MKTNSELEKRNEELIKGVLILQERNAYLANKAKDASLVAWIIGVFGIISLCLLCVL